MLGAQLLALDHRVHEALHQEDLDEGDEDPGEGDDPEALRRQEPGEREEDEKRGSFAVTVFQQRPENAARCLDS